MGLTAGSDEGWAALAEGLEAEVPDQPAMRAAGSLHSFQMKVSCCPPRCSCELALRYVCESLPGAQGLRWLVALHDKRLNGILADEMGLGKTIQVGSILHPIYCSALLFGEVSSLYWSAGDCSYGIPDRVQGCQVPLPGGCPSCCDGQLGEGTRSLGASTGSHCV